MLYYELVEKLVNEICELRLDVARLHERLDSQQVNT